MIKKILLPVLFAVVVLFAGYKAASVLNHFLAISFKEKTLPHIKDWKSIMKEKNDTIAVNSGPLTLRLVDIGGVGVVPDSAEWGDNYSHNVRQFENVIMADSPYVNENNFKVVEKDFRRYIDLVDSLGANGLVFDGFLEYVNFDSIGSGYDVYPEKSAARAQHLALRSYFGRLFAYAKSRGIDIYLNTDMVALTAPLEDYFNRKFGGIMVDNPEFWNVYKKAFSEIFHLFPEVKGFVIRIGEAGAIYNTKGWDYRSELYVKTDSSVRFMLKNLLSVAGKYNKYIIFRTWSVGVGKIGDMHTNPITYERVLGNINSSNLIVSTKYCKGDYDSYLALNPTLMIGRHKRIIEFQDRREFEGFESYPNYMGPLYQVALQNISKKNRNIVGAWQWTQRGGPLRAGPLSLYPFHGFNLITDANVYITSALMKNPGLKMKFATSAWVKNKFGDDTLMIKNITRMLLMSHQTIDRGLYIGSFARWDVKAMGLELTPNMWLFKWDILNGSYSVMSNIYTVCKDSIDNAIEEGHTALLEVRQLQKWVGDIKGRVTKNRAEFNMLLASLTYEYDLMDVLASYRDYFLHYYSWVEKGRPADKEKWQLALDTFKLKEKKHLDTYAKNLDFPAYNFVESDRAVKISERSGLMSGLSRFMFVFLLLSFIMGIPFIHKKLGNFPGSNAFSALFKSMFMPTSSSQSATAKFLDILLIITIILISVVGGVLIFSSFAAPVFAFTMIIMLMIFVITSILCFYKKEFKGTVLNIFSFASPVVFLFMCLAAVMSIRGPAFFWFNFWTGDVFRYGFISLLVFIMIWRYYIIFMVAHHRMNLSLGMSVFKVFIIRGIQLIFLGVISYYVTLEKCLSVLNNELLIIPTALSKILGITTHLNIPKSIPVYFFEVGLILLVIGIGVMLVKKIIQGKKS